MCRRFARLPFFATLVAVAGCVEPLPPMRPVALPSAPVGNLAVVEIQTSTATIDSISVGQRQLYLRSRDNPEYRPTSVELSPGTYAIAYHTQCNEMPPRAETDTVALEAGHRYRTDADCCYWWTEKFGCSALWSYLGGSYETFLWLEDLTTGQVLAGSRTRPAGAP